ncbi:hypothetical protein QF026_004249 [Streptomyces aurantiacus]|uniref:hypothetical protein n=1 Tax=Streptomyces aurantiacus TaxID=47760 RepID=UPI00278E816B|nr:hypothetical protein [Streptomyces aurantiacus]MDQ0775783.1 hypothetical protein [Streptomyces aurantiacus]
MNMPKTALRNSLVAAVAVAILPLLSGCGSSGDSAGSDAGSGSTADGGTKTVDGAAQLTVPDGTDDATKKMYIEENAIAACMKKQGFTYTPHVATPQAAGSFDSVDGQDYALAKKTRQKYGFGTYAAAAYPDDPNAPGANTKGKQNGKVITPDDGDEKGFTAAQQKSYDEALNGIRPTTGTKTEREQLGGCTAEGRVKAYGPELSIADQKKEQADKEDKNRANGLELNGDPQLVQLAQEYADCLKAQGIAVSTTQPTGMFDMVRIDLTGALPENRPELTQAEAMPLLTKDIAIAMKDLECGKKFRAAYFPKEKAHPYWGAGA